MTPAQLLDDLLLANIRYAEHTHEPMAPVIPARKLAIVSCMDARLAPPEALGLKAGDAHILRNAGARVTDDVLRSLAVSCGLLGVRNILVLPHTDCGMYRTSAAIRESIHAASGHDGPGELFEIGDAIATLREDVARIQQAPFLPSDVTVWGGRLDVTTGKISIEVPA